MNRIPDPVTAVQYLVDIGANLAHDSFEHDRPEVIARAVAAGVTRVIVTGSTAASSRAALALARRFPGKLFATAGVHPHHATEFGPDTAPQLVEIATHPQVVAIGECGLDYYRIKNNELRIKEKQREVFLQQIELAGEVNKSLMIHCRPSKGTDDAYEDLLSIIHNSKFMIQKIVHFYVGSLAITKKLADAGFYFTFGGVITFARDYDEVIKYIPLDRIMFETDAPYVAPEPYRGKRNEPAYVVETAKKIAELKNMPIAEVAKETFETAKKVFVLK